MRTARLLTISKHALCRGGYPRMHWTGGVYPSMHWEGGVCPEGGYVSTQGGSLPRGSLPGGCLLRGVSSQEVSSQGVSAARGVCLPRGEGVSAQGVWQIPPCEHNDWQTGVKTLPCHNFVAGGKISKNNENRSKSKRQMSENFRVCFWLQSPIHREATSLPDGLRDNPT